MTAMTAVRQLDSENPWPGLESFGESAHDYFFGRDREAESLLNHVRDASVTVLYGRSGLGKTSLLRAGLFPALREENFLPVYVRLELQEGSKALSLQLHQSVYDSIRASVPDALLPTEDESLWEYLHRKDFELWSPQNYPLTPVIVIDQFEELFTLGERVPDLVREFMNDLGDLAENRIPGDVAERIDNDEAEADRFQLRSHNYKLLITLREDFLPHLEEWSQLIPALKRSRVRLLPLREDKAFDAVYKPATNLMSAGLAERVVRIVAGEDLGRSRDVASANGDRSDGRGASSVEPALLSLFCRELNEERKRRGQSAFDEHLVEEAKRDILSNYYLSCVRDLPPRVAEFIESELITEKGFRDSYAREDAVPSRLTDDELARLIGSRLLRLEEYHGAQRIELTHDVLTGVVREHRDRRRAEEEKAALAARAEDEKRAFTQAAEQHAAELARERQAGRKLRKLITALAVVCVAAVVLAIVAVVSANSVKNSRNAADVALQEATTQKLYGESQLMLTGVNPGGSDDVLGIQELLAALALPSKGLNRRYSLISALNQERDLLKVVDGPQAVSDVTFSPDGSRIASASTDNTVRLWDAATGQSMTAEPMRGHEHWVSQVVFSPDGTRLASAGLDGMIRLWNAATGQPIGDPIQIRSPIVYCIAFSPDGTRIAAGGLGAVEMWDAKTGQPVGDPMRGHEDIVWSVAFSPDGTRIASAGSDKTVRLWDAANDQPIGQPLRGHEEGVSAVAFSPDGRQIVSASYDKTVRLWDPSTGKAIRGPMRHNNSVTTVEFSPDGARIATGGTDKAIHLWDTATGLEIGTLEGHRSVVTSVAFAPDGRRLVSGSDDKTVRIWDMSWLPMRGHDDSVRSARFSDDGRQIASGSRDNTIRMWNTATGRAVGTPMRFDDPDVDGVYPLGAGRLISLNSDFTVMRLWDSRTGKPIGGPVHLPPNILGARVIDWDRSARRIASTVDLRTVQVWDGETMQEISKPIELEPVVGMIAFSSDGKVVATGDSNGSDGTVRLWNADESTPIGKPIPLKGVPSIISFSPGGTLLAVGESSGSDYRMRLWDTRDSAPVGEPIRVDQGVTAAAFSSDGRILAAGSVDGTIRLWDVGDRAQLGAPLSGHSAAVTSLDFSPDGTKFVSASDDHTLRVWPVPSLSPSTAELCAKITHNMSDDQWDRVVSPTSDYINVCPKLPKGDDTG